MQSSLVNNSFSSSLLGTWQGPLLICKFRAITATVPNIPKLCCHVHCHIIKVQLMALQHFGLAILWARVIIIQIIPSSSILIAETFY